MPNQLLNTSMQREVISLHSTPLVRVNIGRSFTEKETECIASIPIKDRKLDSSNRSIQSSQSESFNVFDSVKVKEDLKDIKAYCEDEITKYLQGIDGIDTKFITLQITSSWLNKIKPQEFCDIHNHKNSYLSGIIYFRCLPNDSTLFTNRAAMSDTTLHFPKSKITEFNAKAVSINVKEGDLLLFPSWVPHQVNVNTTDQDRVSLSFDTWPIQIPPFDPSLNETSDE
jgi:uncharacterized protein (TIGR02466 family)